MLCLGRRRITSELTNEISEAMLRSGRSSEAGKMKDESIKVGFRVRFVQNEQ